MNKHTTRNSEEDLWHWAERRDAPVLPEPSKAGLMVTTVARPTEAMAKRWLLLLGFSRSKRG
ncbi:hypothetical protein BH09VER1_BH09VER1_41980 [soil metagenome]